MRKFIAYLTLSAAVILGVAAGTAPTILHLDGDMAYASGKTLYFKASEYDASSLTGNYGDFLTADNYDSDEKEYVVEKIADTMRSRLDTFGIADYQVDVEGYDVIKVSLRTVDNSETQYAYLENYLSFSGGDLSLDASDTSAEASTDDEGKETAAYTHNDKWDTMLDGATFSVELLDEDSYQVPVVITPISDENKSAFLELVDYCKDNTVAEEKDDSGNVTTEGKSCNLVIWANRLESDKYDEAAKDPNVKAHIVFEHSCADDQAVYYKDSDDDKEYPYLQLIPSSAATSSGTYDASKGKEAAEAANYLCDLLNSSAFEYDDDSMSSGVGEYRVSFLYSEDAAATVDSLISLGDWASSPAMGRTMIAALVGLLLLAALLGIFEKMFAVGEIAALFGSLLGTLGLFIALGAQFNIAALLGLVATAAISAFQGLFYFSRLKNEIYKGRTLKKAQQEGFKSSVWPWIDAGAIAVIFGIFLYILGGNMCKAGGVMLVLGGVVSTVLHFSLSHFLGWLYCTDGSSSSSFEKQLAIRGDKIPNLMAEEKQTYFGRFEKKDFTKHKKIAYIIAGIMMLGGIAATIAWGVAKGNVYNDALYTNNATVLRIDVKSESSDSITVAQFASSGDVYDADSTDHSDIFHQYTINGTCLGDMVADFTICDTPKDVFESAGEGDTGTHYYYYYYEATLNQSLDTGVEATYAFQKWEDSQWKTMDETRLSEFADAIAEIGGESEGEPTVSVSFDAVISQEATPYIGDVCLGLGIGYAVALVYMMLRYRPSRGIAATLVSLCSAWIALTFFTLFRIPATPVVALGMILVGLFSFLASVFVLSREKEVAKEDHTKEKGSYESRTAHLLAANSYDAESVGMLATIGIYLTLVGFAIGPSAYMMPYALGAIGVAVAFGLGLLCLAPISIRLGKWFSKIHFRGRKKKAKEVPGQLTKRKKGAEPEEAIFIGIND